MEALSTLTIRSEWVETDEEGLKIPRTRMLTLSIEDRHGRGAIRMPLRHLPHLIADLEAAAQGRAPSAGYVIQTISMGGK